MKTGDLVRAVSDKELDFVYLWETSNLSLEPWNPTLYYKFTKNDLGVILCISGEDDTKEVQILTSTGFVGWALYNKVVLIQCA